MAKQDEKRFSCTMRSIQGILTISGLVLLSYISLPASLIYMSFDLSDEQEQQQSFTMARSGQADKFLLAFEQSSGFFDDITDKDWQQIKARIENTPNCANKCEPQAPAGWYQNNWEPALSCQHERRIGRWGDGGKWICDPHRIMKKSRETTSPCLVYSIGSNNFFTFEEGIIKDISPDCEIHTFDPTIGDHPSNLPLHGNVTFHPWGLADKNEGSYRTLTTIIEDLGHVGREIDILKIDCEGCEFTTYQTWFDNKATPIRQIQLEVHGNTEGASPPPMHSLMLFLQSHGYVVFHKEPNIQFGGGVCIEYAFLQLSGLISS